MGGLRRVRVWAMRAVIFGYFGTLTGPGAEVSREPLAHRAGELLGGCRPGSGRRCLVGRLDRYVAACLSREARGSVIETSAGCPAPPTPRSVCCGATS